MKERRLLFSIVFNLSIVIAEVIGGLVSRSVALLSDAVHNSSDVLSIVFSYVAVRIARKGEDERYTYGYERAEVVAALVNSVFMMVMSGFITYEGFRKILNPQVINPKVMLPVAVVGLAGNVLTILVLHEHHEDISVRSTLVHITADALSSVFVVALGVLFFFKPWYFLDGVFSLVVALYMVTMSWKIFRKSSAILMQVRPDEISIADVKEALEKLDDVLDVHHIHIWTLEGKKVYAELHVVLKSAEDLNGSLKKIKRKLEEIGISHATVQLESGKKADE